MAIERQCVETAESIVKPSKLNGNPITIFLSRKGLIVREKILTAKRDHPYQERQTTSNRKNIAILTNISLCFGNKYGIGTLVGTLIRVSRDIPPLYVT